MPDGKQTSVVEEEERKKIDLKIEVEDFGPISKGEITLKPLTVFIGPNNSGKSYAAMLIHSIFESYGPTALSHFLEYNGTKQFVVVSAKGFPELKKQFDRLKRGERLDISRQSVEAVTKKILEAVYQEGLNDRIVRSFACRLGELVRIGKSSFVLKINHDPCSIHLIYQEGELEIKEYPSLDELDVEPFTKIESEEAGEYEFTFRLTRLFLNIFHRMCGIVVQCHYLPAARSGILQLYMAAAKGIWREVTDFSIARPQVPRILGVVSDLTLYLMGLPGDEGSFYQLARDFEEELIQGEIIVSIPAEYLYPEIKYRFQGIDIPLHRSSSTVSELAPLFLYLKYKVKPNSILMIEEPEAHLHPGNQRILARLLVRLVREGVNIIITTHSDYLLEQLSNFIMLSKVEPKERVEKYKYSEKDFLKHDEIAAYVFNYDAETAGHRIDEVEITEEDGISQEEFVKIIEALYEETIKLRRDLSDDT